MSLWTNSPPKINIAPEEWWLEDNGRVLSYWEGNFSGAMLTNAQKISYAANPTVMSSDPM